MKTRVQLDAVTPSSPIELNGWNAAKMLVSNPTGSPVAIRLGGNDIPSATNYDELCAGGGYLLIPVSGAAFAVGFTQPSLASSIVSSNLGTKCSVTLMSIDEVTPNFGAASFQSLSTSELVAITAFSGPTQVPIQDLGAWGGALVYINPGASSGQGAVIIAESANGVTYKPIGTFAFWPNVPAIIQVPRVARYLSVQLNGTAIAGEPAISGDVAVRATLNEIQDLVYNVNTQPITKSFSLVGVASQQYSFITIGLPAVSIAAIATAGTTAGAALQFLVEASADLVNWRQVTTREQAMSSGITLYRSVGQLDLFTRVTFFQETGGQTLNATAYFSIPPQADLAYILNTIQQSLGDRNQSAAAPARSDIYHELEAIFQTGSSGNTTLASILAELVLIYGGSSLNAVVTALNSINATDTTIANNTTTLTTQNSTLHNDLVTINTTETTNGTTQASINTQAAAVNTNTVGIASALTRSSRAICPGGACAAGVALNYGVQFTAGEYIQSILVSAACLTGTQVQVSMGNAGGPLTMIHNIFIPQEAGQSIRGTIMKYDSIRSPGIQVPAGQTNLWILSTVAATVVPMISLVG